MSADNGIYILKTLALNGSWEYRVKHLQDVGSYRWDYLMKNADDAEYGPGGYTDDTTWHIFNAKRMWTGCLVYDNPFDADIAAGNQHREIGYTEYGISEICIPECWYSSKILADDAVKQLRLSIAFISGELDPKRWSSHMDILMDTRISNFTTYMLQRIETKLPQAPVLLVNTRPQQH